MTPMYAVELTFSDDPTRLALRPAHREHLAGLVAEGRLLAAGPWADDTGSLLLFLVSRRDELDEILAADPYYTSPGTTTAVHEWNPVIRHAVLEGR
jgi:uncharacterized protein